MLLSHHGELLTYFEIEMSMKDIGNVILSVAESSIKVLGEKSEIEEQFPTETSCLPPASCLHIYC